jgi:hypothetical protein
MARYYALSTINAQMLGWSCEAGPFPTREEAETRATNNILNYNTGIERDTRLKNLVIVPSSKLRWYRTTEDRILDAQRESVDLYYEAAELMTAEG